MDEQLPAKLYKYQPYSARTLTNLKSRTLWFAAPGDFNDPFDCACATADEALDVEGTRSLLERYRSEGQADAKELLDALDADRSYASELTDGFKRTFRDSISSGMREYVATRGVACLSAVPSDILMWAHYADGHRGFCLEFSTQAEPFSRARPVRYQDQASRIDPLKLIARDSSEGDLVEKLMLVKFSSWSYECEWRVLHAKAHTAFTYEWSLLTGVFFGAAMGADQKDVIAQLLVHAPTKLYDMRRAASGFAVEPVAVSYAPFRYDTV